MKSKTDSPANVRYYTAEANALPVIQAPCAEAQATVYADLALSPVFTPHKAMFRQQVRAKWRTGEYRAPDDCDGLLVGTTAILSPREATDPKERQIQQLNYDNFISVMAEMIQKYAPKIQKLQEESK